MVSVIIGMAASAGLTLLVLWIAKTCTSQKNEVMGAAGDSNHINRQYQLQELIRDARINQLIQMLEASTNGKNNGNGGRNPLFGAFGVPGMGNAGQPSFFGGGDLEQSMTSMQLIQQFLMIQELMARLKGQNNSPKGEDLENEDKASKFAEEGG